MSWRVEYVAFIEHLAACFDCRAVVPRYCAEAVDLHRRLRLVVTPRKPLVRRRRP
jgi:hypothetical protein